MVEAYLERLALEAAELFRQFPAPLRSLYFGGGTPSFLRNRELLRLGQALPWDISEAEVTMEANPGTLNLERLQILSDLGVNRLSLGVQSFDDRVLKTLGRAHGRKGALKAVEMSLGSGFRTSVDLILGLPEQDFATDLRQAAALGVGHVSAYTLQIEPGTPFAINRVRLDEDLEATAFEQAEEILGAAGFTRYEISNFAKPGQESRHNLLYWKSAFWGALGPSAVGFYPNPDFEKGSSQPFGFRKKNPPLPRWLAGEPPETEAVSVLEYFKEAIMLGLRTNEPVYIRDLEEQTGFRIWHGGVGFTSKIVELEREKLIYAGSGIIGNWMDKPRGLLNETILRLWEVIEPIPYPTK